LTSSRDIRAPKTAGSHIDAEIAQHLAEDLVERLSFLTRRSLGKVRSSSLLTFAICDERELADYESLATHVEKGAVEPTFVVLEDPQPRHFFGQPHRCSIRNRFPPSYTSPTGTPDHPSHGLYNYRGDASGGNRWPAGVSSSVVAFDDWMIGPTAASIGFAS
jgi:hypothetical protein